MVLFASYNPQSTAWVTHGSRALGAGQVALQTRGPVIPGGELTLRLEASADLDVRIGIHGPARALHLTADVPREVSLTTPVDDPVLRLHLQSGGEQVMWHLGRLMFEAADRSRAAAYRR